jgi:hypothetical protein
VALVRTDPSEELVASIIRVIRFGEQGSTLAVTSNRRTLRRSLRRLIVTANVVPSSPILVTLTMEALFPLKRRFLQEPHDVNIPEEVFLRSRRENLTVHCFNWLGSVAET